jgi:hypothetical protein
MKSSINSYLRFLPLLLLLFTTPSLVFGAIELEVVLINKKGIDEELVLVSELHSIEVIYPNMNVKFAIKNGVSLFLKLNFAPSDDTYGPSSKLSVEGQVQGPKGEKIGNITDQLVSLEIGELKKLNIKRQNVDQSIELSIKANII